MQAIQATYQNGVFKPAQPIELPDGSQVTLWVEPSSAEIAHLRVEDREFLDRLASQRAEVFRRLAK
jgi:predicted DNA-binding antitoxin AbrB/MazE fold protein